MEEQKDIKMDLTIFTNIFTGWNLGLAGQGLYAITTLLTSILITRNTRKMMTIALPISIILYTFGIPIGMPVMTLLGIFWFISIFSMKPVADLITSPYSWVTSKVTEYDKAKEGLKNYISSKETERIFTNMKTGIERREDRRTEKAGIKVSELLDKSKQGKLSWNDERKMKKLIGTIGRQRIDFKSASLNKEANDNIKFVKQLDEYLRKKKAMELESREYWDKKRLE